MRLTLQIENNKELRDSESIVVQDDVTDRVEVDMMMNSPKEANNNMINAESSPLSPFKKGRNEYAFGDGGTNFTTKSMEKCNKQPVFQGFTMKNTIDMNTSGAAVTSQLPKPPPKKEENIASMVPANPILPKVVVLEKAQPPKCPIKDLIFIQIQKFKRIKEAQAKMGDGFNMVGKKNMMRENREKRRNFDKMKKQQFEEDD